MSRGGIKNKEKKIVFYLRVEREGMREVKWSSINEEIEIILVKREVRKIYVKEEKGEYECSD